MYVSPNYKTKKAIKEALAAGKVIHVYQPLALHEVAVTGEVFLEGPHYPEPHRWYGKGIAQMGRLVSIK